MMNGELDFLENGMIRVMLLAAILAALTAMDFWPKKQNFFFHLG